LSQFNNITWGANNIQAVDYNGDRKIDLMVGGADLVSGAVRVFLNNCTLMNPQPTPLPAADKPLRCSNNPTFSYSSSIITGLGFTGAGNLPVFWYGDVDNDGKRDLLAGSPSCCLLSTSRLRLWRGVDGGGLSSTPQ